MGVSVRGRRKCSWVSKDVEPPCESFSCSLTKAYQRILMALGVKRGGYALDFADPPEELVCMICHHVAKEAHQVECCGKVFCETCIKAHEADAVSNKEKCPNCKSSSLTIFCDRVSARRIKQLQLSCKNEGMGCEWSGILEDYEYHTRECGFVMVDCPNEGCKEKVPRNNLEEHRTESCQRRLIDCDSCKGKIPLDALPTHPDVCPNVEIKCENIGCSAKFYRRELLWHKAACKKAIIDCPYSELGCKVVVLRSDVQKHLREYYEKHAVMSTQTVRSLRSELRSARRELDSKCVPPLVFKMYAEYIGCKDSIETFGKWDSPEFYTHPGGYSMYFHVIPSGRSSVDHLSLYFYLVRGTYDDNLAWPFDGEVTISILNQIKDHGHYSKVISWSGTDESVRGKPTAGSYHGWGRTKFISHARLEAVSDSCRYIKDDCIYFKVCSINVRSSQKPYYWLDAQTS